jgi:hypothetical protein
MERRRKGGKNDGRKEVKIVRNNTEEDILFVTVVSSPFFHRYLCFTALFQYVNVGNSNTAVYFRGHDICVILY